MGNICISVQPEPKILGLNVEENQITIAKLYGDYLKGIISDLKIQNKNKNLDFLRHPTVEVPQQQVQHIAKEIMTFFFLLDCCLEQEQLSKDNEFTFAILQIQQELLFNLSTFTNILDLSIEIWQQYLFDWNHIIIAIQEQKIKNISETTNYSSKSEDTKDQKSLTHRLLGLFILNRFKITEKFAYIFTNNLSSQEVASLLEVSKQLSNSENLN